jgi:hypothetical protein
MNCLHCGKEIPPLQPGEKPVKYCRGSRCGKNAFNAKRGYRYATKIHHRPVEIIDPKCSDPYCIPLCEYQAMKAVYHMGGRRVFVRGEEVKL